MTTNEAIELLGCQTASDLARELGITPSAVTQWRGRLPKYQVYVVRELAQSKRQGVEQKQAA